MRRKKKVNSFIAIVLTCTLVLGVVGFITIESAFNQALTEFPESYKIHIDKLKEEHPNWTFIPFETGLEWETVIENEKEWGVNVVPKSSDKSWISNDAYDEETDSYKSVGGSSWTQASEEIIRYYMDPRNFLNSAEIFQFEQLSYMKSSQDINGVEGILKGTFMSRATIPDDSITYAEAFMKIAEEINMSPYLIATRLRQEQGVEGTSPLISGEEKGYKGYYNYFNIQASGDTNDEVIKNGLAYAKENGWNTRYKSLKGGAEFLNDKYIKIGQDTLYLQKFDVDDSDGSLYWHQYMQNLLAANSEGKTVRRLYEELGLIDSAFTFKIPIFNNMDGEQTNTVKVEKFNVTFESDGSTVKSQKVKKGEAAEAPKLKKKGYVLFWNKEFSEIYEDTTITATWVKKPKKPVIKTAVSKKKGNIKIKLAQKVKGAKGYEIALNKKVFTTKKLKNTFTNLKSKKRYKVKARAFKKYNKQIIYGPYTKIIKVKIK